MGFHDSYNDLPSSGDYAWAEARSAVYEIGRVASEMRSQQARLSLVEEKLMYITYIEQALDGPVTLVEAELVRKDLKAVLEAETLEDLRRLREQ